MKIEIVMKKLKLRKVKECEPDAIAIVDNGKQRSVCMTQALDGRKEEF